LDRNGFVELANVLEALNSVGDNSLPKITAEDVELMIQASEKQRHEIVDGKIRALYGHSLPGLIAREPFVPDSQMELYHATSPELVGNILEQGLKPMGRQYVHLSPSKQVALEVGRRKVSKPVLFQVDSKVAVDSGVQFYTGNEKVVLADSIPSTALFLKN
ncbi:hypothetical protein A3759_18045, partial [Thalassolituus sp. HI0120]